MGSCKDGQKIEGEWETCQLGLHINAKELLAIYFGLKYLCSELRQVSNSYKNRQHYRGVNWCEIREIWLYASHIPGVENETADSLSPSVEWELKDSIFEFISLQFGKFSVDLFVSRHNIMWQILFVDCQQLFLQSGCFLFWRYQWDVLYISFP